MQHDRRIVRRIMMDTATLLTFAAAAFALAVTPGPDMLLVMTRSVAQGRVAGLVTLAGITAGCFSTRWWPASRSAACCWWRR